MKKSIVSIVYGVSLAASMSLQAAGNGPLQAMAEEHGRQSLAVARQLVRTELDASLRRLASVPVSLETAQTDQPQATKPLAGRGPVVGQVIRETR